MIHISNIFDYDAKYNGQVQEITPARLSPETAEEVAKTTSNERKVALEAQGRTIYNLSVGTPDFAPAEHIRKAMMDAAADPQNWKYSLRDLPELLDAVCGYYKRRFGIEITPDQVASCAGSHHAVYRYSGGGYRRNF